MKKLEVKIVKDSEKDFRKKSKKLGVTILHPKFKAIGRFLNKKLDFSVDDYSSRLSVRFDEKIKVQKNRIEYGEDFIASDGSLVLLRYKLDHKGRKIITEVECFGAGSKKCVKHATGDGGEK